MDLKRIAKDTNQVLTSYLTYQAVRTGLSQLREANLPLYYQLHEFAGREKLQDGEAFISELLLEHTELAFRVMTVRQHMAKEIAEFLPEMLTSTIQQANMGHRKKQLEKMTQMTSEALTSSVDKQESETNVSEANVEDDSATNSDEPTSTD